MEKEERKNANKMGEMPVRRLILSMGAPMMLSMLGQALYNVVDTFFVSHMQDTAMIADMGDKAINALTLAFPIQMLIMALNVGTGVGINAVISRELGRGDRERASKAAGNAMMVCFLYFVAIFIFGITGSRAFIASQTTDADIIEMGTTYLSIVTTLSLGSVGFMCLEKVVMGTGNTIVSMISQMAGAVTNIILDPILIYGLIGAPEMGVAGAAYATVIGQWVSFIVIAIVHFGKGKHLDSGFKYMKPDRDILREVFSIGIPAIVMQTLVPVMNYGMNLILGSISVYAVTAYGVYSKLQNFVYMPVYGLNNSSIPVVSFNRGMGNMSRVREAIKYAIIYALIIMSLGFILMEFFTEPIVSIFAITGESSRLCLLALRIVAFGFLFGGANVILLGVCQSLGKPVYSLFISSLRLVIIVLPLAYALSRTAAAGNIVWIAIPVAEAAACIVAVLLERKAYRELETAGA